VHASLAGPQIAYQIIDSGAKVVIISGPDQAEKLADQASKFEKTTKFVSLDPCPKPIGHFTVSLLSDLTAKVDDAAAEKVEATALSTVKPDDLATILYTSGTTGEPKGVMLAHSNLASNVSAILKMWVPREDDVRLTWLPLSHIFARTCDLYTWIAAGAVLALADSPEAVPANCQEVHPTLINGVPYFFDKLHRFLASQGMADKPGMLQMVLGGRVRYCGSGGAALADHTHLFFKEQGVFISQAMGSPKPRPRFPPARNPTPKSAPSAACCRASK
jgi:long-chain acyl-CoA synthetase